MFDDAFTEVADRSKSGSTLAPPELRERIEATLDAIYEPINNGVYRTGFATTQEAYETACRQLFAALDRCEETLGAQRYLCGDTLTLADVALFTTLLRFDLVYHAHFKCQPAAHPGLPAPVGLPPRDLPAPGGASDVRPRGDQNALLLEPRTT